MDTLAAMLPVRLVSGRKTIDLADFFHPRKKRITITPELRRITERIKLGEIDIDELLYSQYPQESFSQDQTRIALKETILDLDTYQGILEFKKRLGVLADLLRHPLNVVRPGLPNDGTHTIIAFIQESGFSWSVSVYRSTMYRKWWMVLRDPKTKNTDDNFWFRD